MMKTILSIGHNRGMNHIISTLVSDDYQVLISDNVFYGMHLLKNQAGVAIVIIDIDSQPKESVEFIRHIHSSKVYKKPCIVLSAKQTKTDLEESLAGMIHDHFVKPFDPLELSKSIVRITPVESKLKQLSFLLKSRSKR